MIGTAGVNVVIMDGGVCSRRMRFAFVTPSRCRWKINGISGRRRADTGLLADRHGEQVRNVAAHYVAEDACVNSPTHRKALDNRSLSVGVTGESPPDNAGARTAPWFRTAATQFMDRLSLGPP